MTELILNNLLWIEELLPNTVIPKRMHDGVGYYIDDKLILILVEASKSRIYKGIDYPFEIWNGCFFPIEKIKQNAVIRKFLFLENHPALKDCLYLPADTEDFEEHAKLLLREIKKDNPLFGVVLKVKRTSTFEDDINENDFSKPSLFQDVPKKIKSKEPKKDKPIVKKPTAPKKIKADKKSENGFLLAMLKKKN